MTPLPPRSTLFPYTTLFRSYDRIAGMNLNDGKLNLFEVDQKKAVMTEATSAANFFPGYFLLSSLISATDRKSTRLNSSHRCISYAVFCLKKKKNKIK